MHPHIFRKVINHIQFPSSTNVFAQKTMSRENSNHFCALFCNRKENYEMMAVKFDPRKVDHLKQTVLIIKLGCTTGVGLSLFKSNSIRFSCKILQKSDYELI